MWLKEGENNHLKKAKPRKNIIDELLKFGFLTEARCTTWLSNIVLVRKQTRSGACVYSNLNKAFQNTLTHFPTLINALKTHIDSYYQSKVRKIAGHEHSY